jgi:flagellar basal-body rod modification protein FlgD
MIVTPYSPTNHSTANQPEIRTAKKNLNADDFMKLLATQFQNQDPMKPMEDTAFIAQMAQFTSLEQSKTLTAEMAKLRTDQSFATANTYLGHEVTVETPDGKTVSGQVSGIETSSDGPRLVIGDNTYALSSVLLVRPVQPNSNIPAATPTAA